MTNNPNAVLLQQLIAKHTSAKKRMICGIVFIAVSIVVETVGLWLMLMMGFYDDDFMLLSLLLIASTLPFWGMGIPFMITGIVSMSKLNRQIALVRAGQTITSSQPNYQQANYQRPNYQQPNYQQPNYQRPNYQQPNYQQPNYQQANYQRPNYQQPNYQQPNYQQANYQQANQQQTAENRPFVDIDLQKYAPLVAGVSYNPGKDYQFHRAEGFVGSVPQTFVNRTFPKCPLCCTSAPYWTIAQHNQMSWKGNLYLFKCSHCEGIISMSMPDVTTLGNGKGGVAMNPTVGLTNLMVKSSSGKEAGAVYAVIESVGRSGVTPHCAGKEFKLEQLQEMFSRM